MSVQFWPCSGCSRHIKQGDAICPFCGATASVDIGPRRVLAHRLSRAALFAAGAMGAAVASTDCSSGMALYGGAVVPLEDAGASDALSDAATDAGNSGATAGPTDSSSAADVPSAVALYGGIAPPYGLPPLDQ
jgi:hypothetical protein